MGTTKTWYCIKAYGDAEGRIRNKLSSFSEKNNGIVLYYKPELSWISLYQSHLCDGCAYINEKALCWMTAEFESEVLGMSVFDSDIASMIYCENGNMHRYACIDENAQEEFGLEKYSLDPPYSLCRYGISEEILEKIWDTERYIFAEDVFIELSNAMNFCLFDVQDKE